uniref:Uncharacterized protein n=1 Tax=Strigamia maritima TaxID=126957 RepID=T1ITH3_STRMM
MTSTKLFRKCEQEEDDELKVVEIKLLESHNFYKSGSTNSQQRGDCNGGRGLFETHKDAVRLTTEDSENVLSCFEHLREKISDKDGRMCQCGCHSVSVGRCECAVDSPPSIHFWMPMSTFQEARDNLYWDTDGFYARNADRYEGDLYLFYGCQ